MYDLYDMNFPYILQRGRKEDTEEEKRRERKEKRRERKEKRRERKENRRERKRDGNRGG